MSDQLNKISILHITDPHILPSPDDRLLGVDTAYYLEAVLKQATNAKQHYDLCLVTGDLVQTAHNDSYHRLLSVLENSSSSNLKFNCLPGNHDDLELMNSILATAKINCSKHIVLGTWQLICLNSSLTDEPGGYLSANELIFLEKCLRENNKLFSFIALHHHCVPTESHWMDTMIIKNGAELIEIASSNQNVKLLVYGHIHQEVTKKIGDLTLFSTPSTCFQFKPYSEEFELDESSPGYRMINLYSDGSFNSEVFRLTETLSGLTTTTKGY